MSVKEYSEYSKEDLITITKSVMNQLDDWNLSSVQALAVLGLSDDSKSRQVQSFRKGTTPFPETPELMQRIDHIVGITEALRTTFPFSDNMRQLWMRRPHRRFKNNPPLAVIVNDDSLKGLLMVRSEVDCSYGFPTQS